MSENKFKERLINESTKEFEKCLNLLELDEQKDIKKLIYKFLFGDVILIKNNNNYDFTIKDKIDNYSDVIEDDIKNLLSNTEKNELNIFNEIKKQLSKKNNIILNKIKECTTHIEILNKTYINLYLKKYIQPHDDIKILLENKTVLILSDEKQNIKLGEFFTRLIFS